MKALFYLLLLLLATETFAQNKRFSNPYYFLSEIAIKNHEGKKFRYTADLKAVRQDSLSNISIKAMQIGKDNYDFLQASVDENHHLDSLWHTATIESTFTAKTKKIWLYVIQQGNGLFYVDDVQLEVQEADGSWTKIPIKNGNFETELKDPLKDFIKNKQLPSGTSVTLTTARNGKAIMIKANGGQLTEQILYGSNPSAGKYCNINGLKLYYETYGKGEPLLLLHGNGQSISAFSKQIPALAKKYQVIAVDTRAQGKSIDPSNIPLTYELFADDMKALLDSLQLKKVNVLGWSDGGNTALIMAIKYPTYVDKLMVMGANLNPSTSAVEESILKQAQKDLKKLEKEETPEAHRMVRLLRMILTEPQIQTSALEQITAKVLVMAGEKDLIKEAHTKMIANYIKGAKLMIFKGATHFIPEENATLFNETVLQFLTDNSFSR